MHGLLQVGDRDACVAEAGRLVLDLECRVRFAVCYVDELDEAAPLAKFEVGVFAVRWVGEGEEDHGDVAAGEEEAAAEEEEERDVSSSSPSRNQRSSLARPLNTHCISVSLTTSIPSTVV